MITEELVKELENIVSQERVMKGELLAGHCSFRTGGPADLFLQVCSEDELTARTNENVARVFGVK